MNCNMLLLSIKPHYAEKIYNGDKLVELRRIRPKNLKKGSIVLIYESTPIRFITGFFIVNKVETASVKHIWKTVRCTAAVSENEYQNYYNGSTVAVAIFVEYSIKFDYPIDLNEIGQKPGSIRPPQSYRYLEKNDISRSEALHALIST